LNVKVLYFAAARELASKGSETLVIPGGATISDLKNEILQRHPPLRRLEDSVRYSVNLSLVSEEDLPLQEGDIVGVLPAVAGG
jgi:sulfur-carrier protein